METKNKPTNVLIVRFSALGDIAMTIPVVYPLCHANKDVNFVFVTQTWPAGMFRNRPHNLRVIDIDIHERYSGIKGMWRLAEKLKRHYNIDAVADLHSVIRTWALDTWMKLHGVPVVRMDKQRDARRALVSASSKGEPLVPTATKYREVFEKLGLEAPDTFTTLYHDHELPTSEIVPEKKDGEKWIAISPFSSHDGKTYPIGLMTEVIKTLSKQPNMRIFLLGGGKKEKMLLRPFHKKLENVVSLAETKHNFTDEYALLGRCDLMLTMDSANMHLASLMGVPSVVIWGATTPACGFCGHLHDTKHDVALDYNCRPCGIYGENDCRYHDFRCLANIAPETVINHVLEALKDK